MDTVLVRAAGWRLPAYAPGPWGYVMEHGPSPECEEDPFVLTSPLRLDWDDFREHPDEAGYLLVRSIYQAFHLHEERIPSQYDRVRRRLVVED